MKTILSIFVALISISALANDLADYTTTRVDAEYGGDNVYATQCEYAVRHVSFPSGRDILKVYLAANEEAEVFFALDLPSDALPLREGVEYSQFRNQTITYEDGVLKLYSKRPSDQYFGFSKDIEKIEIEVDPYLKNPGNAKAYAYTRRNLLPNVKYGKLECSF